MELREYQLNLIKDTKTAFRQGNKRICAVLPCGGGKSVIAGCIAKSATDKGNRVLFIVHRHELCEQIKETFSYCGVDLSLCHIGMVQTITRRIEYMAEPALIIVDEAHHIGAKSYMNIIEKFSNALVLGFTATPLRLSTGGLGNIFHALVTSVSTKWLIENKYLSPYKYYSVQVADFSDIHVERGEYSATDLSEVMESKYIYGETISNYKRIADGKKSIIYCVSVKSAQDTAEEFRLSGYSAEALDGKTDKTTRSETMNRFRNNEIQILVNCELFGEGLDIPDVECCILLRKTKSLTLYIQQSMRAMRYRENKTAIIIDHVGNCFEHDLPDADREWSLAPKKKRDKSEAPVKTCEKCYGVCSISARMCPYCGFEFEIKDRDEKEILSANLEEITKIIKPYNWYKKIRSWEKMLEFANERENVKYKIHWCVYKCLELDIPIPLKYKSIEIKCRNKLNGGNIA